MTSSSSDAPSLSLGPKLAALEGEVYNPTALISNSKSLAHLHIGPPEGVVPSLQF